MSTLSPVMPPLDVGLQVPVLEIKGLNHWFGKGETQSQVLKDINLTINRGEIVIMLGPSGCGKTTILTLIGGLRTVQQGSLKVLGQELLGLSAQDLIDVRRRIGFIFQAHNLFSSLTAQQNVEMALELQEPDLDKRKARAVEVLSELGLKDRLNYRPDRLSGGLKQRVAIARALANRPRLVLADEPTAALDAANVRRVVDELRRQAKAPDPEQRATILVVTHDEKILEVADRIIRMEYGRIVSNVSRPDAERIIGHLKSNSFFAKLTDETLNGIAFRMTTVTLKEGDVLFREGEEGDRFYLIIQGVITVEGRDGNRPFHREMRSGEVFGEKALINPDKKRTGSATAKTPAVLYSMDERDFKATIGVSKSLLDELRRLFTQD